MTTSTAQKINLDNCTHEELFKALTRIEARIATTSLRDKDRVAHPIKHIVAIMAEHYVSWEAHNVSTTRLGNPQFWDDWLPRYIGANKIYWEKKGVTGGKLLIMTLVLTSITILDSKRAYSKQCLGPLLTFCH